MAESRPYHVLFLCTGNSARSQMAECLLTRWGRGRFVAHSAGSKPKGFVHPRALAILEHNRLPTTHLNSKDWAQFMSPGADPLDFVFTLCDRASQEICPVWPGNPITANWSVPEPAEAPETEAEAAFREAFRLINTRVQLFTLLRPELLDRKRLRHEVERIGRVQHSDTNADE